MLEDYQINEKLRYADHRLVADKDVQIGGVLGAALLSALLVDTEEGTQRGIAIDSEAERRAWMRVYEREVRRDAWGMLFAEIEQLSEAYIALVTGEMSLFELCPNVRLLDLAMQLTVDYMRYLTQEIFGAHIWEGMPWKAPFAEWLLDAARFETRRQRLLKMNWTDAALVTALYEELQKVKNDEPTFIFEGEAVEDILKRYCDWVWSTFQAQLREIPGSQPRAAKHRNYMVEQETDWRFIMDEVNQLSEAQQREWTQWMLDWKTYITRRLKPQKEVLFWTAEVSEKQQRQLTQFLRIQEKEWDYYKCLSASIYALRQMGYVRRASSITDITRWMTENLNNDYTTKNNRDQFRRAWNELGRYSEDVKHYVRVLNEYGIS